MVVNVHCTKIQQRLFLKNILVKKGIRFLSQWRTKNRVARYGKNQCILCKMCFWNCLGYDRRRMVIWNIIIIIFVTNQLLLFRAPAHKTNDQVGLAWATCNKWHNSRTVCLRYLSQHPIDLEFIDDIWWVTNTIITRFKLLQQVGHLM